MPTAPLPADPTHELTATLPVLHRLALAYAPARARTATLCLLALDARLADTVRGASEPLLAQIRLAWWRETLAQSPDARPRGEPLLAALAAWGEQGAGFQPLVDGWEQLAMADMLDEAAVTQFASGRALAFGALAKLLGHPGDEARAVKLAKSWAIADLAAHLDREEESALVRSFMADEDWNGRRIARDLRPLVVLHAVAARCARRGVTMRQTSRRDWLAAVRVGLFGR